MKLSYATASKLSLTKSKLNIDLPTGYIMIGEKCLYNCSYCSQSKNSYSSSDKLSRVTWKKINFEDFKIIYKDIFKRICLQIVSSEGYEKEMYELISYLKTKNVKLSVSIRPKNIEEVKKLFNEYQIDNIGISIDVVNPYYFKKYRKYDINKTLNILNESAKLYNGKITTHVIVGLGENDKEILQFFEKMKLLNITIGLFAFTPLKGTSLENKKAPALKRYRQIQYAKDIIFKTNFRINDFIFDESNNLISIPKININYLNSIKTSGCSFCTRPYYNEKPNKTIYNIPNSK